VLNKVKIVLKKRKAKLFFLFLLLSGLAWFISNLSHRYQSNAIVDLTFVNPPDSMMLLRASKKQIGVKLDAVGFQFLAFGFGAKKVNIDLSKAQRNGTKYTLSDNTIRSQIEGQLAKGINLIGIDTDKLVLEFYGVVSKKVRVMPKINFEFSQNYLLDGPIVVKPDSIVIKGPSAEIDSIRYIRTEQIELSDLKTDFSVAAQLRKSKNLEKTLYSFSEVVLSGKISRFSEKILSVPVSMSNLPENTLAQTFPEKVEILIKASISDLKKIKQSDFKVVGDYKSIQNDNPETVLLRIVNQPSTVHSVELKTNHVDFILKRE